MCVCVCVENRGHSPGGEKWGFSAQGDVKDQNNSRVKVLQIPHSPLLWFCPILQAPRVLFLKRQHKYWLINASLMMYCWLRIDG